MSKKLLIALVMYAAIALLAWSTLDASFAIGARQVPLRDLTLAILGLFAVRTLLHAQRERIEQERDLEAFCGRERSRSPQSKSRAWRGSLRVK